MESGCIEEKNERGLLCFAKKLKTVPVVLSALCIFAMLLFFVFCTFVLPVDWQQI